ncbi:MAG: sulfotransferase domain-containing protein [bacterium]|nr:sulfotransferase domain-containing protein [bacterium]
MPPTDAHKLRRELKRAVHRARRHVDSALGRPRKTQIVICGFPRSGTSLLYNMLAATLPSFAHDDFEHSCLGYVREWRDTLSKRPLDVFKIEDLVRRNRLGKRLVVIVTIRDPRDVLTSRHPRVPDDYFIGWSACYRVDGPQGPELAHPGIGAIAKQIEALGNTPGIDLLRVRYEDLVADPGQVQARLERDAGLRFVGSFADFHRADRLAYRYDGERAALEPALVREDKPVDRSRAGKWRAPEHAPRIRDEFTRHPELFSLLARYGYEQDEGWYAPYGSGR